MLRISVKIKVLREMPLSSSINVVPPETAPQVRAAFVTLSIVLSKKYSSPAPDLEKLSCNLINIVDPVDMLSTSASKGIDFTSARGSYSIESILSTGTSNRDTGALVGLPPD